MILVIAILNDGEFLNTTKIELLIHTHTHTILADVPD
jgi:hypothetical protein